MKRAELPAHESRRLEALRAHQILDTVPEQAFDDLALLASEICGTPISLVSLIDGERQWFKARLGLDVSETPRDVAFCAHAILGEELFIVPDAQADARFADNPLVTGDPHIRFYAGAPLFSEDGYAMGTLCVIDQAPRNLDASQRRALDALSRQVSAQLTLRRRALDLERMQRIQSEFISMVSHELRTPMTSVLGALRMLEAGRLGRIPNKAETVVGIASRNAKRLMRLVNDFLDFQKLEAVLGGDVYMPIEAPRLIEAALDSVHGIAEERKITISIELVDAEHRLYGNEDRLVQVLTNLLGNALKLSPEGEEIVVRVSGEPERQQSRISVIDRGPGFTSEEADRLFAPFAQLDSHLKLVQGGTGLGLAIARRIIQQHGGDIGAEGHPGEGATFWFTVPWPPDR